MFSGVLIRMGKELGIPTPYNEYTYHIIKALEEKNDGRFDLQCIRESIDLRSERRKETTQRSLPCLRQAPLRYGNMPTQAAVAPSSISGRKVTTEGKAAVMASVISSGIRNGRIAL